MKINGKTVYENCTYILHKIPNGHTILQWYHYYYGKLIELNLMDIDTWTDITDSNRSERFCEKAKQGLKVYFKIIEEMDVYRGE